MHGISLIRLSAFGVPKGQAHIGASLMHANGIPKGQAKVLAIPYAQSCMEYPS
jgi:hypothetical protein